MASHEVESNALSERGQSAAKAVSESKGSLRSKQARVVSNGENAPHENVPSIPKFGAVAKW